MAKKAKKKNDGKNEAAQDSGDDRGEGTSADVAPAPKLSRMPRLKPPVPRSTLDKVLLERPAGEPDRSPIAADETRVSQSLVTARTGQRFGPPRPIRVRLVP